MTRATLRVDRVDSAMNEWMELAELRLVDRDLVNINEGYEVRYWMGRFRCTAAQLLAAIATVGTKPDWVQAHLRRSKQSLTRARRSARISRGPDAISAPAIPRRPDANNFDS